MKFAKQNAIETAFRDVSVGNFDRRGVFKRRTKRFQKISREFFSLGGLEV